MYLVILIKRNKFVHSAMKNFKQLSKKQLINGLKVEFEEEEGIDGGNN